MDKERLINLVGRQTIIIDDQAQLIENLRAELVATKKLLQTPKDQNGTLDKPNTLENNGS